MQEINPQTGTRLDCPWPWSDKFPQEDGYCLQQRQQRSPRFLPRHRSDDLGKNNYLLQIQSVLHNCIDVDEELDLDNLWC